MVDIKTPFTDWIGEAVGETVSKVIGETVIKAVSDAADGIDEWAKVSDPEPEPTLFVCFALMLINWALVTLTSSTRRKARPYAAVRARRVPAKWVSAMRATSPARRAGACSSEGCGHDAAG
jgi:hypothetical protein